MISIGNYTTDTLSVLKEAIKYFVLLLLCILAIRLWHRFFMVAAARTTGSFLIAAAATVLACGVGYVSMRQSLALMDSYFGMRAFEQERFPQSFLLFQEADHHWRSADAVGKMGVSLLMLDDNRGLDLMSQARTLRHGHGTYFEFYHEGFYRFVKGDSQGATPFLQAATNDPDYDWEATKLLAIIALDQKRNEDATALMEPFMQAPVTGFDQAYIMASIKLAQGKTNEARTLLDKFPDASLSPWWTNRFEKLRSQLNE
jgi:hypothetical protein